MGELIHLAKRRDARRRRTLRREPARAQLYFDLASPFTYLVTERVERSFDHVTWTPACSATLERGCPVEDAGVRERVRAAAEQRAVDLRLPLVWPERFPSDARAAMRAASFAAEAGRGGAFVLAAGRLAFCGGFDLDDPEVLAEAAAAAAVPLDECMRAARDPRRDAPMEVVARRLLAAGADRLPALQVGRSLFWGETQLSTAVAASHGGGPALMRV
jgi:2-hydroxychromene-2-carboxylate isomerase